LPPSRVPQRARTAGGTIRDLADRVAVLNFGKKIAEGSFEEVARDPGVIEAYLGEEADGETEPGG
jgi:ABC-type branched-subunit amino acid transport system ATPase component